MRQATWREKTMPKLQREDRGSCVELVQSILVNFYKYSLPIDGFFGKITEACVRDMQILEELPVSGIVDQPTWARLFLKLETMLQLFEVKTELIVTCEKQKPSFFEGWSNLNSLAKLLDERLLVTIVCLFFACTSFLLTNNPRFLILIDAIIENIEQNP